MRRRVDEQNWFRKCSRMKAISVAHKLTPPSDHQKKKQVNSVSEDVAQVGKEERPTFS